MSRTLTTDDLTARLEHVERERDRLSAEIAERQGIVRKLSADAPFDPVTRGRLVSIERQIKDLREELRWLQLSVIETRKLRSQARQNGGKISLEDL